MLFEALEDGKHCVLHRKVQRPERINGEWLYEYWEVLWGSVRVRHKNLRVAILLAVGREQQLRSEGKW